MDLYAAMKEMQEEIIGIRDVMRDLKFRIARIESGEIPDVIAGPAFTAIDEVTPPDVETFSTAFRNAEGGKVPNVKGGAA